MSEAPLSTRMQIKPGHTGVILNAPENFVGTLFHLPEGVILNEHPQKNQLDFVQLFIRSKSELEQYASFALDSVKYDGLLWIAYPKKSSKIRTDIDRDHGWEVIDSAGYVGVASISIDSTWSALRFRPKGASTRGKK